jgi:hypothetical protein
LIISNCAVKVIAYLVSIGLSLRVELIFWLQKNPCHLYVTNQGIIILIEKILVLLHKLSGYFLNHLNLSLKYMIVKVERFVGLAKDVNKVGKTSENLLNMINT